MNYLLQLPIDIIKIDKSFTKDITRDTNKAVIAKAIIAMAHGMELSITAEGIENREQLEFFKVQKCDKAQGYLLSKPLPGGEIENLFKEGIRLV